MKRQQSSPIYFCAFALSGLTLLWLAGTAFSSGKPSRTVTLIYTNDTNGYLQACGCTARQVGGLAKRATLIKRIQAKASQQNSPTLLVDGGNLGNDLQTSEAVLESMRIMHYQALGVGDQEEQLGAPFLRKARIARIPLLSGLPSSEQREYVRSFTVLSTANANIGIISIPKGPLNTVVAELLDTIDRIRKQVDLVVLLSRLDYEDELHLAHRADIQQNVVVLIGMRGAPQSTPVHIHHVTLVPVTPRGTIGILNLALDPVPQVTHRFETVSDDLPPDRQVQDVVSGYYARQQQQLMEASLKTDVDWTSLHYAPASDCQECHAEAYGKWQASKHAMAAETLKTKDRLTPACLTCHSEFYRRVQKFNPTLEAAWHGVECTTCHGDGIVHSALRSKSSIARKVPEATCRKCHDPDNDPNFEYEKYLAKIRHW